MSQTEGKARVAVCSGLSAAHRALADLAFSGGLGPGDLQRHLPTTTLL